MKSYIQPLFLMLAFCAGGCMRSKDFVISSSPRVGNGPFYVCAADVNGDGKVDLIGANKDGLIVFTNDGSGGFVFASSCRGDFTTSICAADVNGDGKVDLICAHQGEFNLTVLTNDGSGGFVFTSTLKIRYPSCICAADVNGDGKMDLISGSQIDGALTVLTNNGSGGFLPASTNSVGVGPVCVIAVDVNGDGKVDLISANFNDSTLSVLINTGNGGFVRASTVKLKNGFLIQNRDNPQFICAADVNGDGKMDLISANYTSGTLSVLINNIGLANGHH